MDRVRWNLVPPAIIAMIVVSFLAATAVGQWRMRMLDESVDAISHTTAPSIDQLTAARRIVARAQIAIRDDAFRGDALAPLPPFAEETRQQLARRIDEYLALPVAPPEQAFWRAIVATKDAFDRSLIRFEAEVNRGDLVAARRTLRYEVAKAADELDGALMHAIEFNSARSRDLAIDVRRVRERGLLVALALDVVCTLLAVTGALALRRVVRAHDALMARHLRLEKERSFELEQFAGRVAHDILSPLSTVGFALELGVAPGADAKRARMVERGSSALRRVKLIVTGLLDFARAGAAPDHDAHASVADVMTDLAAEIGPTAAAAGAELKMTRRTFRSVFCNPGVLTSLVANLVRNAIKYIGDGPVRRVEVRAIDRGDYVRIEVADTGPGLPPDLESRVFDPYVRSGGGTQSGIGLGLATVKRLAEAHGGRVGVRSSPGAGCTFWFELPAAESASVLRPESNGGTSVA